jgi:hypothetical protein
VDIKSGGSYRNRRLVMSCQLESKSNVVYGSRLKNLHAMNENTSLSLLLASVEKRDLA